MDGSNIQNVIISEATPPSRHHNEKSQGNNSNDIGTALAGNNNAAKRVSDIRYMDDVDAEDYASIRPPDGDVNSDSGSQVPIDPPTQLQTEEEPNDHLATTTTKRGGGRIGGAGSRVNGYISGISHRIQSGRLLYSGLNKRKKKTVLLGFVVIVICVLTLFLGLVIWGSTTSSRGKSLVDRNPLDPAERKWSKEESTIVISTEAGSASQSKITPTTGATNDSSHSSGVKLFRTDYSDHYRILHIDTTTDSILVGARNNVFNISMKSDQLLKVNKKIEWTSDGNVINVCKSRGNSEGDCQNYIRVIVNQTTEELFICGTNAFKPACRVYTNVPGSYEQQRQEPGVAKCPFDPRQNNTYLYADGQLYSGTVADINVRDPLIYRAPMRTEQYDSQVLNDPHFVNAYDYGDNVYFLFREFAVEYINCGKAVYSRVARICKKDQGGLSVLRNVWTSFFKSRLNCSIPGDFPFYFDEIQSTTDLGQGHYKPLMDPANRTDMIYGVFNTPQNSIAGSAVCAYRMSDVIASFEGGFKEQKSAHFTWLPVNERDTPKPHPAKCNNDSKQIPVQTLNFIKSHPLMDMAVPPFGGRPILVQTSMTSRMTQIAVDWQRPGTDGKFYDVLFIGTSDGTVIKALNRGIDKMESVIIEEIRVFQPNTAVTGLKVYRSLNGDQQEHLIVLSERAMKTVPLHRCGLKNTCSECIALKDPYCSWDNKKCRPNTHQGIQNIVDGTGCAGGDSGSSRDSNTIASASASAPTTPPCVCPEQRNPVVVEKPTPEVARHQPPLHHAPVTTTPVAGTADGNHINIVEANPATNNNRINILPEGRILEQKDPDVSASTKARGGTVNASTLAISLVFSILIALCVGFFAGYRTSVYRYKTHTDELFMSSSKTDTHKTLNRFDDPNHYNSHDYTPQPRSGKQLNVVFNPLKSNTKLPNGSAETKVQQKVKKVYL